VRLVFGIKILSWRSVIQPAGDVVVHFPKIGYDIARA
jgi:hypothetical protein